MLFEDRVDAGKRIAARLQQLEPSDCLILAIPRGGVVVGGEIADLLNAPLDVVVPRKLGAPEQPELAIGAVSSWAGGKGKVAMLDDNTVRVLRVSSEYIMEETEKQLQEIDRRLMAYRGDAEPPELHERTAILVDDGIATGYTMLAAIRSVRSLNPSQLIVAAPVASQEAAFRISREVDKLICLETPEPFLAVGYWYNDFRQITDEEVIDLLRHGHAGRLDVAS